MSAPINTYDSPTQLHIPQNPPVVGDQELYNYLSDVHDAIIAVLTAGDNSVADPIDSITKFRRVRRVDASYSVNTLDGTILVDASAVDVVIDLPLSVTNPGYRYTVKVIAQGVGRTITVEGNGGELIDTHALGVNMDLNDSYTFLCKLSTHSTEIGYAII